LKSRKAGTARTAITNGYQKHHSTTICAISG